MSDISNTKLLFVVTIALKWEVETKISTKEDARVIIAGPTKVVTKGTTAFMVVTEGYIAINDASNVGNGNVI